jgi:HK97 family phage major capsid protein
MSKPTNTTQAYSLKRIVLGGDSLNSRSWEYAVSEELSRSSGVGANKMGVMVPFEALVQRSDLAQGTNNLGGYLVQTSVEPSIKDALIPFSALAAAGMTIIPNLTSNVSFPRWATQSSPSGLLENTTITSATETQTFSSLVLGPALRQSAQIRISAQLLKQQGFDGEAYIRKEILRAMGSIVDLQCIAGNGSPNTIGLLNFTENTGDASTVTQDLSKLGAGQTFAGAATWPKLVALKKTILANNVTDAGDMSFLVSPATYAKWSQAQKASGTSTFLIEDGKVGTDPVIVSNSLSATNQCLFGKFSSAHLGLFGLDVVSDYWTGASVNQVILTINLLYAFGCLYGPAINRSEDSAAV